MARQEYGSYCYRPKGSSRFWFRFQYPKDVQEIIGRRKVEFALQDDQGNRTTDPQVAELLALPHITHHKLLVHEARNRLGGHLRITIGGQRLQPGEHVLNGKTVIATDDTIFVPREPATLNALLEQERRGHKPGAYRRLGNALIMATYAYDPETANPKAPERPTLMVKDEDSVIVERYIKKRRLELNDDDAPKKDRTGDAAGVRRTLADLKEVTGGKMLRDVTPEDIEALVAFMKMRAIKSQRVQKLLALLRAACNVAKLNPNPLDRFEIAKPYQDAAKEVPPYSDDDVALIRANIDQFPADERLMVIWHISSGIRPGGLYSIASCDWEVSRGVDGVERRTRFVTVNADKGKYGRRSLPIPQAVLESGLLPERIAGPLWARDLDNLLNVINNRLERIGVNVGDKTLYSGRHRARDRLLDIDCPDAMSRAIMGHARRVDPHDRYGHGFRQWKLKPYVDQIGF